MSEWTVDTLKKYIERIFAEMDRRYQQRFESQETRLHETRMALEKRLDGLNENRSTVADLVGRCMTREEVRALVAQACLITGTVVGVAVFVLNFFVHR